MPFEMLSESAVGWVCYANWVAGYDGNRQCASISDATSRNTASQPFLFPWNFRQSIDLIPCMSPSTSHTNCLWSKVTVSLNIPDSRLPQSVRFTMRNRMLRVKILIVIILVNILYRCTLRRIDISSKFLYNNWIITEKMKHVCWVSYCMRAWIWNPISSPVSIESRTDSYSNNTGVDCVYLNWPTGSIV